MRISKTMNLNNCQVCGRFQSQKKPCKNDHTNLMDAFYERMSERSLQEYYDSYDWGGDDGL